MAKQSGLGDQLFIEGYDVGADINSIGGMSNPRETLPGTGITQSAMARLFGKRDAAAEFVSYFNDATDQVHDALSGLPTADVHLMYLRGEGAGNQAYCTVGKQIDYAPTRGDDGSLLFSTSIQSNSFGADWGRQLTAGKVTHASATDVASVDLGTGSKSFGFQAYLQVFSLDSGTATVTLEESSDDDDADAWEAIAGGSFTAVTDQTVERIQSSSSTLTVERYVRVTTTGTFSNLVFCVVFVRNKALRVI